MTSQKPKSNAEWKAEIVSTHPFWVHRLTEPNPQCRRLDCYHGEPVILLHISYTLNLLNDQSNTLPITCRNLPSDQIHIRRLCRGTVDLKLQLNLQGIAKGVTFKQNDGICNIFSALTTHPLANQLKVCRGGGSLHVHSTNKLETFPAAPVQMISQEGLHFVQPCSAGATFIES